MRNKQPQVILFQDDEIALGYEYDQVPVKLSKDIIIKSIDYDYDKLKEEGVSFVGTTEPSNNSVYFKHPYKKDTYVQDTKNEDYYLKEKVEIFKKIGQQLGAKKILTKVLSLQSEKITTEINADGSVKVVKAEVGVTTIEQKKNESSYEIEDTYELLSNFDLDKNIEDVRLLINDCNLNHESELISLIDARDSKNSGTTLKTRKVKSELTSEYNHLLDISLSLSHPVFNISSSFKKNIEKIQTLKIEIEYTF
ncbi:hypothetical protein [Epilithonimonas hispanica]|uniref:Uncharacterized protein n=1 Tax=Epilithonimonas hispanica TaxID=358687 RepID=A0A3D9CVZ6_9FLAO|nr:hypothetical protein [Epilithonimonas hispanica]REC69808.1 hypothetical protein DRF58_12020 [Epilithonimonas hispanica]